MEDWNKKLIEAADKGRVEELKLCLANGANIDNQYGGWTALMFAASEGHVEVSRLLLENRCNKDITQYGGWTALMLAASEGHVEVSRLLLENKCNKDITSVDGWTALMLAAMGGRVEVSRLLLENRCNKDITDNNGNTALHLAAEEGELHVTRYLVEEGGISPFVKTHEGKTPYDLAAARKRGQYKEVMEYLQTAAQRIKDNEVPTEIELMADKRSVPLYLKLLESGSEKKRDIRLVIVGKKGAGKTSLVNRLFKEGKKDGGLTSLFKRFLRRKNADVTSTNGIEIHVIKCKAQDGDSIWNKLEGNYKETELNARLLKPYEEELANKHSLASIEKAAHNTFNDNTSPTGFDESKVPLSSSQSTKLKHPRDTECKEETQEDSQIERLVATAYTEKNSEDTQVKHSDGAQETFKDNTLILYRRVDESNDSTFFSQQGEKIKPSVVTQVEPPVTTKYKITNTDHQQKENLLLAKTHKNIKAMIDKSKVDLHDKEEYVNFLLWDFAGDEEFYHTHQTFLSQDAIYLVVTKLNEANDKNAQNMFQLWMNSIHCYCRLDDQQNEPDSVTMDESTEKEETNKCDPPVILVGSHKDKVINAKGGTIGIECKKQIESYVKGVSDDACGHIRSEYFISNTKDDDGVFQKMKQDILTLARGRKSWNKAYPLKFTQLEKSLQEKMIELQLPIITFLELMKISLETPMPMNNEELKLFLKFHHELRALVYFEDLPDFIILDTQWLSDAFKCIVTAEKFQFDVSRHKMKDKLEDLNVRGILHTEVLDDIFKDERNVLYKHDQHKDDILNIMEKFDIIIPATRESADEKPCFYVPCMVKSQPKYDTYKMLNVTKDTCQKSTWLCFKFRFLPPHLINHLIASLSRVYEVAQLTFPKKKKLQVALFKDNVVFELKQTKLRKLLLMKFQNIIQVQVLEFGTGTVIKRGLFKDIGDFVTDELKKIIHTRFKMPNVEFEKKFDCGLTEPELVTGSNEFSEEITEYLCGSCTTLHPFIGEWSKEGHEALSLSKSPEDVPRCYPHTESFGQVQTMGTSTKVRVRVQAGERVFSNINDEATGTDSSSMFTKEEINFTKMGMIALNIFADVLYDLLKQDKANVCTRTDCDITYLYREHRKLNKHIPSNSWGGSWQTIQTTDIAIGDDIERIRLTRNELQHSRIFKLDETRFNELSNMSGDILKRFDRHNTPTRLYTDHLNDILAKTISAEEVKSIENEILGMTIEVEIEH